MAEDLTMQLIDGKAISEKINNETKRKAEDLKRNGVIPGLAVVLVGTDPASVSYVRSKDHVSQDLGFYSKKIELPEETSQKELLRIVAELNSDNRIHGILVQSPLPKQIDEGKITLALDPAKDVDGFHPVNVGKLAIGDPSGMVPCTPLGCQRLLLETGVTISGSRVVILGRSMLVGKPLALLLMAKGPGGDATVTVVHSRSRDLVDICSSAEILVAAMGQPGFVKKEHVREGAIVIDVGTTRVEDTSRRKGFRLAGDVEFDEVAPKTRAITPVPGGVGPMTIAMLMQNTLKACQQQTGLFV
jgi:methylenetetrahydrofolate dehydrogenase (NADP+)/methenyltetrahydrofolate cyclohydrolase